jgi:outer membrane protein assembly factor BamA
MSKPTLARLALRRLGCVLVLCTAGAAPVTAQLGTDDVEVLAVAFSGVGQLSADLLRTAIETTATRCTSVALQPLCWLGLARDRQYLDRRALAADVFRLRVFYYQRGYRAARVDLDTLFFAGGVQVRFRVAEGEPVVVKRLTVDGAQDMDSQLGRNLPVRTGRPFSMIEFEATRDTLRGRLANRGFADAEVLANYDIPGNDHSVDVEFLVIPGRMARFGAIDIIGASRVSPAVVQRMLTFREGDAYSRQALLRSQRNLFGLEVFRHAEIVTMPNGDSVRDVRIQVNEGDLHRVRVGVGVSTTDFVNAEGRWVGRNFLGGARRLEVRGRVTNMVAEPLRHVTPPFESCAGIYCDVAGSLATDFSQPWFFGPANSLGAGMFVERFSLAGVYVRTSRGAYGSLGRSIGRAASISALYRPELTRLESDGDLIFCVNFIACESRDIDVLREPHWLSPVGLNLFVDRSNSLLAPTRGYIVRLDSEIAGAVTGSEFSYARFVGEVSGYHEPFRGVVIASRLRSGYARAVGESGTGLGLHPQKRFFAGGPNSVRGFAQFRLGPKLLTVNAAQTLARPAGGPGSPGAGCSAQQINGGACDVAELAREAPAALDVRPVGGAVALEGNMEVRYPIWADQLRGATFLDFGQVWRSHDDVRASGIRFTPGVGIRYFSPVGPIRVDVGYHPGGAERLAVVTTEVCNARIAPCGEIEPGVTYAPGDLANRRKLRTLAPVAWRPHDSFTDRLQFHFSIGQAF